MSQPERSVSDVAASFGNLSFVPGRTSPLDKDGSKPASRRSSGFSTALGVNPRYRSGTPSSASSAASSASPSPLSSKRSSVDMSNTSPQRTEKRLPRRSQSAMAMLGTASGKPSVNVSEARSSANHDGQLYSQSPAQQGAAESGNLGTPKPPVVKGNSIAALRLKFLSDQSPSSTSPGHIDDTESDNGIVRSRRGTVTGQKGLVSKFRSQYLKRTSSLIEGRSLTQRLEEEEEAAGEKTGGKIVIYTTSVSTVRVTFDNCQAMRLIFQTRRVPFEERDISMSKDFAKQLEERAPGADPPVCFFNGKLLGSFESVQRMNETEELEKLLENMPRIPLGKSGECGRCGGRGFIPCTWCGGDRKSMASRFGSEVVKLKCTCCNENGLMRCTACYTPGAAVA